jgi:hypothetical protein
MLFDAKYGESDNRKPSRITSWTDDIFVKQESNFAETFTSKFTKDHRYFLTTNCTTGDSDWKTRACSSLEVQPPLSRPKPFRRFGTVSPQMHFEGSFSCFTTFGTDFAPSPAWRAQPQNTRMAKIPQWEVRQSTTPLSHLQKHKIRFLLHRVRT